MYFEFVQIRTDIEKAQYYSIKKIEIKNMNINKMYMLHYKYLILSIYITVKN